MFNTIKTVIQFIPLILELIKALEVAIPEGGKGKEKLAFIKDTLLEIEPDMVKIWGHLEFIITRAVALFNATGLFRKE